MPHVQVAGVTPLIAWAWGSPWMLLWSLAAAIPILIHLWNKRQQRETTWAAMRFLRAALERHARRLRLQRWLLLALRVAPLALLGLALADPAAPWMPAAAVRQGAPRRHHVAVVDASYSMQTDSGAAWFSAAQREIREMVAAAPPGDAFTLAVMSDAPQILTPRPLLDKRAMLAAVDRLQCGDGGAPLAATAELLLQHLRQLQEAEPDWRHELRWYSDLTRATWTAAQAGAAEPLEQLSEIAAMHLVDVAGDEAEANLAVTDIRIREPLPMVDAAVTVEASAASFAEQPASAEATFFLDGQQVGRRTLQAPPGGSQQVALPLTVREPGEHWVTVELSADSLTIDNRRRHVFTVRQQLRALCIEGRGGDARAVALALRPAPEFPIQIETAPETALLERDLAAFDCVVVTNVGRISAADAGQLLRYVRAGGALMMFLGDLVQAESWNESLFDVPDDRRLLPARLGPVVTRRQGLDPLEHRHPIIAVFANHEGAGLRSTPVSRCFQLRPAEDAVAVLALANGDPLMLERKLGHGRCLLIGTAPSPQATFSGDRGQESWSELAQWPSFLPLMQRAFEYLIRDDQETRNTLVGRPISGYADVSDATLSLATPDGERHQLPVEQQRWSFVDTERAGLYRIARSAPAGAAADARQLRAVNVATAESDLRRLSRGKLPPFFRSESNAATPAGADDSDAFRWVLALMLALLVGESWYANRLAARSR